MLRGGLADPAGDAGTADRVPKTSPMATSVREIPELELALLRRGLDERSAGSERCGNCTRTPLIGERVYVYGSGLVVCELCREHQREDPADSHTVRGPEFGHTMRIIDQRTVA
jgi:hypothetical protein